MVAKTLKPNKFVLMFWLTLLKCSKTKHTINLMKYTLFQYGNVPNALTYLQG